jgi:hypothetical protein
MGIDDNDPYGNEYDKEMLAKYGTTGEIFNTELFRKVKKRKGQKSKVKLPQFTNAQREARLNQINEKKQVVDKKRRKEILMFYYNKGAMAFTQFCDKFQGEISINSVSENYKHPNKKADDSFIENGVLPLLNIGIPVTGNSKYPCATDPTEAKLNSLPNEYCYTQLWPVYKSVHRAIRKGGKKITREQLDRDLEFHRLAIMKGFCDVSNFKEYDSTLPTESEGKPLYATATDRFPDFWYHISNGDDGFCFQHDQAMEKWKQQCLELVSLVSGQPSDDQSGASEVDDEEVVAVLTDDSLTRDDIDDAIEGLTQFYEDFEALIL